jgi:hypothetical protein
MLTVAALAGTTIALAACTDKRVQALDTGITRDSALSVISKDLTPVAGRPSDSLPNVYRKSNYLIGGKMLEVLYFTPDNSKPSGKDTIPYRKLTPIVFFENKLIGKGWPVWDSIAKANKIIIPEPKTQK